MRIVDGRVYVNDVPLHDDYVPAEFRSHDDWGPQVVQQGYYFVMAGRPPEQQLPTATATGAAPCAERSEHRRQGSGPLVAAAGRADFPEI